MIGGMLAFSVRTELVPYGWWGVAGPGPFIAHIGPDTGAGAFLFGQHLDRGIISKDGFPRSGIAPDNIGQWFQQI